MGWNIAKYSTFFKDKINSKIDQERFYFVHSYKYFYNTNEFIYAHTKYGEEFASIIGSDNIVGCQFHPEKSHVNGMNFLNFLFQIN